ncbi:hypothetical protein ACTGW9_10460, partial [Streptococcus suis]
MKLQKLGILLQLPSFHHFYNISVRSFLGSLSLFIIAFSKDNQLFFYHLSSLSRYLMKNMLRSIVKIRKLFSFELKFRVKSAYKTN